MWGVKLEVSLRLSPSWIVGSLLTLDALYTPTHTQMWVAIVIKEDGASIVLLNGSPCGRREGAQQV